MVAGTESAAARVGALSRVGVRTSPAVAVGAIVALSIGVRLVAAWARSTPDLFPDEYIYTELARSIANGGVPSIRGHAVAFPSLLAPLLTAPAWLVHDTVLAYRIAQAIGVVAMSLAAVPAYLLARRVRLSVPYALAIAFATVTVPDFLFASYLVAEPFAYPLVLAATVAGAAALERPSRRGQAIFLALSLLAMLARVQFVILPLAFLAAALVVGQREHRLRRVVREQALLLGLSALGAIALAVFAMVGFYGSVVHGGLHFGTIFDAFARNVLVLAYASGWVTVPGALVGLALAVARPVNRSELAFGAFAMFIACGVLGEAVLYGGDAHERYVIYVAPLLFVAFALYARRGFPAKLAYATCAILLVAGATRMPLSGIDGVAHSPVLLAIVSAGRHIGGPGDAASIALDIVLGATAILLALSRLPRAAATFALLFTVVLGTATWALSANFDVENTRLLRQQNLPAGRTWVDATGLRHVALVETYEARRGAGFGQLFWNRSIDSELLFPGGASIDSFSVGRVIDREDGTMLVDGKPVMQPLLIDAAGGTVQLRGARLVASAAGYDLWRPTGTPRLALYYGGRSPDGWLSRTSWINLWPDRGPLAGTLTFNLSLPRAAKPVRMHLLVPGGSKESITLAPGRTRQMSLPVCTSSRWQILLQAELRGVVEENVATARSSVPVFRPDPAACVTA